MEFVFIKGTLGPELLARPELAPLLGKEVRITVVPSGPVEAPPVATEFIERCKAFVAAHGEVTAEEARAATAGVTGSLYDREDD